MAGGGEEVAPKKNCCNGRMIIQSLMFLIWTALSVALIVVGARYKSQCPAEPFIPVYMIVAGAFSFAYWVLLPFECCFPTIRRIVMIMVAMFVFAWFIAGSVWVFRIYNQNPRQCQSDMYLYVFSILIIQYIFIALGVIASLLACLCCENSCVAKICGFFQTLLECCPCLEFLRCLKCSGCIDKCLQCCKCLKCCQSLQCCNKCLQCCQCCSCLQNCNCLQSCNCLQDCNCLQSCLECLKCSNCCRCLQCCDCFKSLCCCCKNIQCSSCLNCSMCAQCCKCLQCCSAKV